VVDFFISFEWRKTQPHDELVNNGNYCLAKPGDIYAVYLPRGGNVTVRMQPGQYLGAWWNPTTGEKTTLPVVNVTTSSWSSPQAPGSNDWALLLEKK
jgi:Putative collagen-binding domain of a collagenase